MRFNIFHGQALACCLLASTLNTVDALDMTTLDQSDYDCSLPQIFSLQEAQMDLAQVTTASHTKETNTGQPNTGETETGKTKQELQDQVDDLESQVANLQDNKDQTQALQSTLSTITTKINDVKAANKDTSVEHLALLEKLETLADKADENLKTSESEKSAHRTEMKNLMNNVKTKVHSTSLNHADHAAWAMAAIAGIFQGIGLADSFFAGRNQKSEVETMVRESLYYQEKGAGVHQLAATENISEAASGRQLAQTDTTKPGEDVLLFPLWVALTNLGCTAIGGFVSNMYIRYLNDKDKWAALKKEAKKGDDITEWYHARIMKDKEMSGESVDKYFDRKVAETKYFHRWMKSPEEKEKTTQKPAADIASTDTSASTGSGSGAGSGADLGARSAGLGTPASTASFSSKPPSRVSHELTGAQTGVSDDATYAAIAF